jgi:hypothetical protein
MHIRFPVKGSSFTGLRDECNFGLRVREARCRLLSFQVLKEKYLNRWNAWIYRKNTPAGIVFPVNCAAMIAALSAARHSLAERRTGRLRTWKTAAHIDIEARRETSDRALNPCEPRQKRSTHILLFCCPGRMPIKRVPSTGTPSGVRRRMGREDGQKPASSRTINSCPDACWWLFGQLIPKRSCLFPCGFISMRRRRLAGRGAAKTGNPLLKRGVGREELHEVPAGKGIDDQHMSR